MKQKISTALLFIIAVILAILLFFGKGRQELRSIQETWDSGHIIAFWLWSHLLLTRWPALSRRPFWQQAIICMTVGLAAGIAIEAVQGSIGRTLSISDIQKNMVGCAMAISTSAPARKALSRATRVGIQLVVVIALIVVMLPMSRAIIDDLIAWKQFPLLCSFETPFENERWIGTVEFAIDHNIKRHGNASLKVIPKETRRTRATLLYLGRNWNGYHVLEFDVYNPRQSQIHLMLGVHDEIYYRDGWKGEDRFLRTFRLAHGWNHMQIPLEEIRTAPKDHPMMMSNIREITFWAWQHERASVIYIDEIKLSHSQQKELGTLTLPI
jgi:VanZ family protein